MKTMAVLAVACVLLTVAVFMTVGAEPAKTSRADKKTKPAALAMADYRISGPYTHENLAIFLVHGEDRIKGEFLTLQEAMEAKKLIVHETGNVNSLTIENVGKVKIYIQSGEIIKGGKQDRMFQYDYIVPAMSGKKPISSFCVEQGRWRPRGKESSQTFGSSNNNAVGNTIKLAAKLNGGQGKVWSGVKAVQGKLSGSVGQSVNSADSATSLQLSLENKKLKAVVSAYKKKLAPAPGKHKDVVGFAVVINGEVTSLDLYACRSLFVKLWPKQLETSAFEAVADRKKGAKVKVLTAADVREFALAVEKERAIEKKTDAMMRMKVRQNAGSANFATIDADNNEIHSSYLKKDK